MNIQSVISNNFQQVTRPGALRKEAVAPNPPSLTADETNMIENKFKPEKMQVYDVTGNKEEHYLGRGAHIDRKV